MAIKKPFLYIPVITTLTPVELDGAFGNTELAAVNTFYCAVSSGVKFLVDGV